MPSHIVLLLVLSAICGRVRAGSDAHAPAPDAAKGSYAADKEHYEPGPPPPADMDINERLKYCCEHGSSEISQPVHLRSSCMHVCSWAKYNKHVLHYQLKWAAPYRRCSGDDIHGWQLCLSRGHDHSDCCRSKGVTEDCIPHLCDFTHEQAHGEHQCTGRCTRGRDYERCLWKFFNSSKQCFIEYDQEHPPQPTFQHDPSHAAAADGHTHAPNTDHH